MAKAGILKHLVPRVREGDAATLQLLQATCRASPAICQAACLAGLSSVRQHAARSSALCRPALPMRRHFCSLLRLVWPGQLCSRAASCSQC